MNRRTPARAGLLVAAVALLLLPGTTAQQAAYYTVDEVEYYFVTGHPDSLTASWLQNGTASAAPFDGCTWAKVRPDKGLGRINTIGRLQGFPVLGDFTNLVDGGGIAESVLFDGDVHGDGPQHDPVHATMAAWGNVSLRVDNLPFVDPVTGRSAFAGTWFVTGDGLVDDATHADAQDGGTDWEMHWRARSPPGHPVQEDLVEEHTRPEDGIGFFGPNDNYQETFRFYNERFGGTGHVTFSAFSMVPGAAYDITVRSPNGTILHEAQTDVTFGGSPVEATFPLDRLGPYEVEVQGDATGSQYRLTMQQETPATFDLALRWERVVPGHAGLEERRACEDAVAGQSLSGLIPPRPDPPAFQWIVTVMTIGAVLATLLVTVNFAAARRATSRTRSAAKKRT